MASDIVQGKVLTSKSGTLAYLAPEVYAGNGYDVRADWWSLGVLFYECIYNKVCLFLTSQPCRAFVATNSTPGTHQSAQIWR